MNRCFPIVLALVVGCCALAPRPAAFPAVPVVATGEAIDCFWEAFQHHPERRDEAIGAEMRAGGQHGTAPRVRP